MTVLLALLVEEEQVAAPQIRHADKAGNRSLLLCTARKRNACLAEAVLHEPAAIESGRARAAVAVGLTEHLCSIACGAVRSPVACARGCDRLRLLGPGLRRARTTGDGQDADQQESSHAPMLPCRDESGACRCGR